MHPSWVPHREQWANLFGQKGKVSGILCGYAHRTYQTDTRYSTLVIVQLNPTVASRLRSAQERHPEPLSFVAHRPTAADVVRLPSVRRRHTGSALPTAAGPSRCHFPKYDCKCLLICTQRCLNAKMVNLIECNVREPGILAV